MNCFNRWMIELVLRGGGGKTGGRVKKENVELVSRWMAERREGGCEILNYELVLSCMVEKIW